ncbi:MAG: glutamate racemase [Ardenticatenaceae bacterium]|nr:glutamate racemase [Anaerolineales bacterium]MCB8938687.1 glutamate racemase [Ardenticatenaceae bacterium]MCB8973923.1 glutamate racemase [Ardenticatenaceae bacterium]
MSPIGVFDSGVGGLSVLRHLWAQLPAEQFVYLADQGHVPYGSRSAAEIIQFSQGITQFFQQLNAKAIVIACNTASAAALSLLREQFDVPFVGMEPAVKPAAQQTQSGKVGILATGGTFASDRYARLTARYAQGVTVWEDPCVGLVPEIEAGRLDSPAVHHILQQALAPMLAAGVDTVVLGCTHYPFVLPVVKGIVGTAVSIIDPAPAVARQTSVVLQKNSLLADASQPGNVRFITTGPAEPFARQIEQLLGLADVAVETAVWHSNR